MAIFALLLISGMAISLIIMAGTEAAINGNYRGSTQVFYAAYSGLEEARGRLSSAHPQAFITSFIAAAPAVLGADQVRYILNPSAGEIVDPTNLATTNPYRDVEYQQEFGVPVTSAVVQTTNSTSAVAGLPGPVFKWVRITAKTERSSNTDVDGDAAPPDTTTPVFYDGSNQNLTSLGGQVFNITSLAVLPDGSQRMLHYDVAPSIPIPVDAAIHTLLLQNMGHALNITGFTDPVCSLPGTYGARSGSTIWTPGDGDVTGSPAAKLENTAFPYQLATIIRRLTSQSTLIDSPGAGVTGVGSPVTMYTGPHALLGVVPTVTYDASGGITAITAPGTPGIFLSPADLTLGISTVGGAPVNGHGILMVQGNLKIDITNGFNFFGLIIVTGDISMTANSTTSASSNIHGAIIGGGKFTSDLTDLSGSVFIHQNACMVQNILSGQPLRILAFREVNQ